MVLKTEVGGGAVAISPDGANDYDSRERFPAGLYLTGIELLPSASSDLVKVRRAGAMGPIIARLKGRDKVQFSLSLEQPYIAAADCKFKNPADAKIILRYG